MSIKDFPAAVAGVPNPTSTRLPPVLGGVDLTDHTGFAQGVPYDTLARLRADAPVFLHPAGQSQDGEDFWVLTRHTDVVAAASDPVFSSQGGGGRAGGGTHLDDMAPGVHPGVLVGMIDDPRHALLKGMMHPCVGRTATAALRAQLRDVAAAVVSEAVDRGACDFAADVCGPYATAVVALVLGAPRSDWEMLTRWTGAVSGLVNRRSGTMDGESQSTGLAIREYCQNLLAMKRARPASDLATVMATADLPAGHDEPGLTEYEREANLNLLFLTGVEQPRNTGAGGVLALAEHPDQWCALLADRSLLPGAVEEMFRWAPPNAYNRRTATEDVRFHDTLIGAGQKVTLWWAAANRDERVFPAASAFDIRRDPNPHVSFGAGVHSCLADEFARTELRVLIEALLDRVAEIRLSGPVTWTPSNKHAVVLEMPVELVPASPRSA